MKLATYLRDGIESYGAAVGDAFVDFPQAWPDGPQSMLALLEAGPDAMARAATLADAGAGAVPASEVTLLAPLPRPPKVIAIAGNYVKHIQESRLGKGLTDNPHETTVPRPFLMPGTCIAHPGAIIEWPCYSRQIDYEAELTVVIGARAKCVSADEARRCVAGFTIANDISARSTTFADGRAERPWDEFYDWLNGKWADGFCPIGPYLTTADEIDDVRNLGVKLTVNGAIRQDSNTSHMIFDAFEMVAFLSHIMTLTPGDIIATGTPSGVGAATGDFLDAGDVMTATIDGLGELTNTLGPKPETFFTPCKT